MKTNPKDKIDLLDEILASEKPCPGPSEDGVIALIQTEKARRRHRRQTLLAAACLAISGLAFLNLQNAFSTRSQHAANPVSKLAEDLSRMESAESETVEIERVDDERLLELLGERPAALVRYPDGERRLMLVAGRARFQ